MSFSASGMKPPGLASAAPAPAIAAIGAVARPLILSIIPFIWSGFGGRRDLLTTQARITTAKTTSTTATHVLGEDGVFDAATSPSTKAAATPIASVAVSAPR